MPSQCWRPIGLSPWLKHLGSKRRGSGSGVPTTLHGIRSLTNKADALHVVSDALIAANRTRIVTLALSSASCSIMSYDDYVAAGGLMSYGPDYPDPDLPMRSPKWWTKFSAAQKPGDIPVEQLDQDFEGLPSTPRRQRLSA